MSVASDPLFFGQDALEAGRRGGFGQNIRYQSVTASARRENVRRDAPALEGAAMSRKARKPASKLCVARWVQTA